MLPWCRKHGKKHGIHGETMVSPCFPCFSMLCKSMEKHGKHGNICQVAPAEHGLAWNSWDSTFLWFKIAWKSMGSMEQHFVMISDSMEKHGEYGIAFSHDFRRHGKAWEHGNSSFSCLQLAWKSMGSMVQHSLIISDSMESIGSMEKLFLRISDSMRCMVTPHFQGFKKHGKA